MGYNLDHFGALPKISHIPFTPPQDEASYQDMLDGTTGHIKSFFAENSTLATRLEEAGENIKMMITSAFQNSSLMDTWNKTMQEAVDMF